MAAVAQEKGFEHAWSDFRHEFFFWKTVDSFKVPPPVELGPHWQALLAGAAEYLCHRYGLSVPAWTEESAYTLAEVWDPWEDILPSLEASRPDRIARTPPEFLHRNVVYEARNLIAL